MKLVAMLRIKNQILTIRECLDRLNELVDEIVVLDNGSTDGTIDVYAENPKIVAISYTEGFEEGRDKIFAHELAKTRKPDWILWVDADEVFEKTLTRTDLEKYMNTPNLNAVWFRLFHFWQDKLHVRIDSHWLKYTAFPQRVMWRNLDSAYFDAFKFHNGAIKGVAGKQMISSFRLKHFGYVYPEQIQAKDKTYSKLKDDKRSYKTMSMTTKGMKRLTFLETGNRYIDLLVRVITDIFLRLYVVLNQLFISN